jgi:hypothetical protein
MPTPYTGINMSTRPRGHSDYLLVKEHGKSSDFPKQLPTAFNRQSRDLTHLRPVRGRRIIASRFGLSTPVQMIFSQLHTSNPNHLTPDVSSKNPPEKSDELSSPQALSQRQSALAQFQKTPDRVMCRS